MLGTKKWLSSIALALSIAAAFSASICRRKWDRLSSRVRELEASLEASAEKAASERRGRVRAQQELRKALAHQSADGLRSASCYSYPMAPIGVVQSCFSTRNGTPRQPLLVPLSRACLVFDASRVPMGALEGLSEYSHCWIIYVFHLNTDLEKLWKQPSQSKFKAKVRVPRLKGGKMGVLATRSPHRPCPIGLTVAKVEALAEHAVLLSGVDLVDGTPVLDIKPYLPYSDCIQSANVPKWLEAENVLDVASVSFSMDFPSSLSNCWSTAAYGMNRIKTIFMGNLVQRSEKVKNEKHSLYATTEEFQRLIKEVLSWDIRSLSQQRRPHNVTMEDEKNESDQDVNGKTLSRSVNDVTYHLVLEGVDVSYRIDEDSNIVVEKAILHPDAKNIKANRHNYSMWREMLRKKK